MSGEAASTGGRRGGARLVREGPDGAADPLADLGDAEVVLGRSADCDVVVPGSAVSRRHMLLRPTILGWEAEDLGSKSGTWIDGTRIDGPSLLRPGARIRLGRALLRFEGPEDDEDEALPAPIGALRGDTDDPLVGKLLGDVRLLARIGVGAAGHVYRGRQENLGRDVAVKALAPHLAESPERVESFLREARAAGRLIHPSIVTVFDARTVDGTTFFLMELMEGGSVEQARAAAPQGRLPWKQAFPMLLSAARGLEYLHGHGLLHRDVKPGNLLLTADGTAKLADLGIALEIREAARAARAGTPHYAAPEIVRREPPSVASDLYSLGATFHHVLTGRTPFEGADRRELLQRVAEGHRPRVMLHAADVPVWLGGIVDRLTAADPRDRYASAADLVQSLEQTEIRRQARALGIGAPRARGRR